MAWETLKKSIHGLVNKVSKTNLPVIVRQLFGINIIRGRCAKRLSLYYTFLNNHVYHCFLGVFSYSH